MGIKAGEKITADDGTVWGEFVRDIAFGEVILVDAVIRVDGTRPNAGELMEPEVRQFFRRRHRELYGNATQEA